MTVEKIGSNHSDQTRLALLEQAVNNINNTLSRLEQRLSEDRSEMRSYFKWTMSGIFGTYAIMISCIVTFVIKFSH